MAARPWRQEPLRPPDLPEGVCLRVGFPGGRAVICVFLTLADGAVRSLTRENGLSDRRVRARILQQTPDLPKCHR